MKTSESSSILLPDKPANHSCLSLILSEIIFKKFVDEPAVFMLEVDASCDEDGINFFSATS